jgi:hypothetical protein
VVGGWTQTADGRVLVELLEKVPRRMGVLIEHERERLESWFGGTRVIPRFRTPLEKALAG